MFKIVLYLRSLFYFKIVSIFFTVFYSPFSYIFFILYWITVNLTNFIAPVHVIYPMLREKSIDILGYSTVLFAVQYLS